jgi:hypothetical protein
MLFMLIDTREEPPGRGDGDEPWLVTALRWVLPWPALIVWLFAAGQMLDGWPGAVALWAAVIVGTWRALRWMPGGGSMREYRQ